VDTDWTHSETIAIAKESCVQCQGVGLRDSNSRKGQKTPCNCVLRNIFRLCYARFRYCIEKEKHVSHVRLAVIGGTERRTVWGRRDEEYIADFCLVSKRVLEESEYKLFRFHFLLGADWKLCCRQLKMDRGNFFHEIYRIQQKLGRVYRDLEPYPLYPLDEYFGGTVRKELGVDSLRVLRTPIEPKRRRALRPPLKKVA
jgi:hypothetical protein